MRVALCSLVLNESEFLNHSYAQHKDWPGLVGWIFVEGADRQYALSSPEKVSPQGLSTDDTTSQLDALSRLDCRVMVDHYGWMQDPNAAQSKTKGRDRYLYRLEDLNPDIFIVLDADEFYTRADQWSINQLVHHHPNNLCWRLTQRHLWRPPSIRSRDPFTHEVTGGYWAVRHTRIFRWESGIRYSVDHNYPQSRHYHPLQHMYDNPTLPECIHLGFARSPENRLATNRYYVDRGEGRDYKRKKYVDCRNAWERWKPGQRLPNGAKVDRYRGPIPECFTQKEVMS